VAHQICGLVFHEETHAWKKDEHFCKCRFWRVGRFFYRVERVQSYLVRAN
jgi:hypothetical protein